MIIYWLYTPTVLNLRVVSHSSHPCYNPADDSGGPAILSSLFSSPSFWYLIILWQALSSKLAPSCRKSRPTQLTSLIKDALINSGCSAGGTSTSLPHRHACACHLTHAFVRYRALFQIIRVRFNCYSIMFSCFKTIVKYFYKLLESGLNSICNLAPHI